MRTLFTPKSRRDASGAWTPSSFNISCRHISFGSCLGTLCVDRRAREQCVLNNVYIGPLRSDINFTRILETLQYNFKEASPNPHVHAPQLQYFNRSLTANFDLQQPHLTQETLSTPPCPPVTSSPPPSLHHHAPFQPLLRPHFRYHASIPSLPFLGIIFYTYALIFVTTAFYILDSFVTRFWWHPNPVPPSWVNIWVAYYPCTIAILMPLVIAMERA